MHQHFPIEKVRMLIAGILTFLSPGIRCFEVYPARGSSVLLSPLARDHPRRSFGGLS